VLRHGLFVVQGDIAEKCQLLTASVRSGHETDESGAEDDQKPMGFGDRLLYCEMRRGSAGLHLTFENQRLTRVFFHQVSRVGV
jgi:hypothetical protein